MTKDLQLIPGLPKTPGWVALNRNDQNWIQEHTSNFVTNYQESGQKMIQACMEMGKLDQYLDSLPDQPMKITDLVVQIADFLKVAEKTGWNILKAGRRLVALNSEDGIRFIAERGFPGFNSVGIQRLLPILESNPAPKGGPKALEPWREKIAEGLKVKYSEASKKRINRLDPEEAMKAWLALGERFLIKCKMETTKEERDWMQKAIGYLMDRRNFESRLTITTSKIAVPEDWWLRRGAPKGPRKPRRKRKN